MSEIRLYPFQERGLNAGRAAYGRGRRSVLFVGPTGMGKTTLASAAAVGRLQRGGKHVVAIAHRKELVEQLAARFAAMGLDVGALGRRPGAPVQVTSIQTILARRTMPEADFVIVDEAHHYVSDQWLRPVRLYQEHGAYIMGLTATPCRDDGRGLGHLFDELIVVAQVSELVALNGAEPEKGITPIDVVDPDERVRKLAQNPCDAYMQWCPGRSCVVFSPHVLAATDYAAGFARAGIEAPVVHGELATAEREKSLARFARGDVRVLVNVNVLTEGWDAPICDVAMLARRIQSFSLLVQCIGRARRPYPATPGKRALLIDLAGNLAMHGFHPDDEIVYSLEGVGMCGGKDALVGPRTCRACGRVLVDDIAEARARGEDLTHCPECDTELSRLEVPESEDVALRRREREESRARIPKDKRVTILTSLYAKGIKEGRKRANAEFAYRGMFKHFPPGEVRAPAWKAATEEAAAKRGGHFLPP